ncbi:MAG: alkaline phosphatase family protein [Thermoplasmata archaeon]
MLTGDRLFVGAQAPKARVDEPQRRRTQHSTPLGINYHWKVVALIAILLSSSFLLALQPASAAVGPSPQAAPAASNFPTPIRHVIVLFMEDQGVSDVLANGSFERYLLTKYAFASQYDGLTSDSLANYRITASGQNSNGTATTLNVPTLVDNAGESWAAFEESMPTPCDQTSTYFNTTLPASVVGTQTDHLVYDVNHDPFVVFNNITHNLAYCKAHVLNLDAWTTALQNDDLPNYVWIAPNDTDNDHHCPPATCPGAIPHGDAWLRAFLSPFLNSSAFSDSVVFLTFDYNSTEGYTTNLAPVYFAALSPWAKPGYESTVSYTHYNLLTTTMWLLGLGQTLNGVDWTSYPPMMDLFDFAPFFNVTFTESGLPAHTNWTSELNGLNESSTSSSIVFSVRNGSYPYTVDSVPGFTTSPSNGLIDVMGAPVTQPITFNRLPPPTYNVSFTESGLQFGTNWSVTLNSSTQNTTTSSISFQEPNGTYSYTAGPVANYTYKPSTGMLTVSGASPPPTEIEFQSTGPLQYAVAFTAKGLPTGTAWFVILNGTNRSGTGSSIEFQVPNGTFAFSVGTLGRYLADPSLGSVIVLGSARTVEVNFTLGPMRYAVTFSESGLTSGTNWSVTTNGTTLYGKGNTISFLLSNGSFAFSINGVNGYAATPSTGSFVVNGTGNYIYILFTTSSSSSSPMPDWALYSVIAEIAVLVALIPIAIWMIVRKRRSRPPPAQPWKPAEAPPKTP